MTPEDGPTAMERPMSKDRGGAWLQHLQTPLTGQGPLYLELYGRLRQAILRGGLKPGTRLPSSRTLAQDLEISRTTAEEALSKLEGEGFLVRRVGDGTYVSDALSHATSRAHRPQAEPRGSGVAPGLSRRGAFLSQTQGCVEPLVRRPFAAGQPSPEAFPYGLWQKLLVRRSRESGRALLGYGDPAGYGPLREAIAQYLISSRGVVCGPDQVLVLTSSQQALDLSCKLLLDPGDKAWLEEPGYPGARAALLGAGADITPVPVDSQGLDVAQGQSLAPHAKLAYVTPSHQYPLGATLSLNRRLALLRWARNSGAWIIEDDYDSEFRYQGRPLAAIQGLEEATPVIYVGTFTKAMFPSLRIAYVVAPKRIIQALTSARSLQDGHTPSLMQAVLADFIQEGHFHTHLRKMKSHYQARRDLLLESLATHLGPRLLVKEDGAGLHVTTLLPSGYDDEALARRAALKGLDLPPLSGMHLGAHPLPGLVLGYAALSPDQIQGGVAALARLI
jgi:GntR family transcriptional regulator/MocR family aminotransferase